MCLHVSSQSSNRCSKIKNWIWACTIHYANCLKSDTQKQNGDAIWIFIILEILIEHVRRRHREVAAVKRTKNSWKKWKTPKRLVLDFQFWRFSACIYWGELCSMSFFFGTLFATDCILNLYAKLRIMQFRLISTKFSFNFRVLSNTCTLKILKFLHQQTQQDWRFSRNTQIRIRVIPDTQTLARHIFWKSSISPKTARRPQIL